MMDNRAEQRIDAGQPQSELTSDEDPIDIAALTDAVERLWRRDLEIERERLGGGKAPRRAF